MILVVPLGISPAMILVGKTCLKRMSAKACLFSGFNSVGMVPSGSFAKASLVGAKTVKSPSPLSVPAKSAAFTAANRVDKAGSPAAVAAIDFNAGGAGAVLVSEAWWWGLYECWFQTVQAPPGAAVATLVKKSTAKANEFMVIV